MTTPFITPRTLLQLPDFRLLFIGQAISNFGDSMTNLALLLLINHLTGSTAALATMAIVLAVPTLTFGLIFRGVEMPQPKAVAQSAEI